jgi:hypothetical protein
VWIAKKVFWIWWSHKKGVKMMQYFKLVATFLATILMLTMHTMVSGHTYKNGACPLVEPMQNFEMKQVIMAVIRLNGSGIYRFE